MTKIIEKENAIELRRGGLSVGGIAKELKVAKSTVFRWVKNIPLTEEQKAILFGNSRNTNLASAAWSEKWRRKRLQDEQIGKSEINRNSWEHAAGCMLWWAEGDKSKTQVGLTNCDEEILKFFVAFLKKYYNVPSEKFSIYLQYHEGANECQLIDFWKCTLGLEGAKAHKGYCKPRKTSKTKWPNGVCRVRINSAELSARLWDSVQEYMGFVRKIIPDKKKIPLDKEKFLEYTHI